MPRLREWFVKLSSHTTTINLVLAISLTIGKWLQSSLPSGFFAVMSIAASLAGVVDKKARQIGEEIFVERAVTATLKGFLKQLPPDDFAGLRPRVCVYLPMADTRLVCRYRTPNSSIRHLPAQWGQNQGVVGLAYSRKEPLAEDVARFRGMSYVQVRDSKGHSDLRFGLTPELWDAIRDLGFMLCVPIPHPDRPWDAVGVLSLESELPMSKLGSRRQELVRTWTHQHAPCIAVVLSDFGLVPK